MQIVPADAGRPGLIDELATLLVDCVRAGASLGFLADLDLGAAAQWWTGALASPGTSTWLARDDRGRILGCVRLLPAGMPNQRHRADVSKLLVHPQARGLGVSSALMLALEAGARERAVSLLVLDTETDSPAESIYRHWGWRVVGRIDDYARSPDGTLRPTTIMTRRL